MMNRKPKRLKETYDPSWGEFERQQLTHPLISKDEWQKVLSRRRFRENEVADVKFEISMTLIGFMRLGFGYLNAQDYRDRVVAVFGDLPKLLRASDELAKFNDQRRIMISALMVATPKFPHAALPKELVDNFVGAGWKLFGVLRDVKEQIDAQIRSGPDNEDVFWLVAALNQIVLRHSDGGKLTLSRKPKAKGNDDGFVEAVLKIAQRETGRQISASTIKKAILRLKDASY